MNKLFVSLMLFIFSSVFTVTTLAESGGFVGPMKDNITTVKEALDAEDDTQVTLTGYITSSLGDEKYHFKDDTGEMVVDIDDDDWNGLKVTPETKVIIQGEVDMDGTNIKIDVDTIDAAAQ
ncbi:YgiW/YdeI family stress tolerance OB fold protein [uncultured Shewanella sp.]|uniref:YgiW/YdeI family stress tolerance OB fold protein n=1 Tax=uncultured Shewanella sp. TaxID=173975 RepID=UPI002635B2F9|nr:NirD/YgiW/YdeI family stress tolerance protein [uncultured Shewanella sp.]